MKNSVSATICSILHGGVLDTSVAHQLGDDALVGVSAVLELPLLVTRIHHVGLQVNLAAVSVVAIQRGGLWLRRGRCAAINGVCNVVKCDACGSLPTSSAMTQVLPFVVTCHSAQLSASGKDMV